MTENLSIKSDKKSLLRNLLVTLEDFLNRSKSNAVPPLSEQFFTDLKALLDAPEFICGGINLLDSNDVNIANAAVRPLLEKLFFSLRAIDAAAAEADQEKRDQLDNQNSLAHVVIHNREIAERLASDYNSKSFAAIFDFCRSKGVFSLRINETTGLVATAEAEENWDMSGRQWVTDTVRCGDVERVVAPAAWRKAMLTLCDFYQSPKEVEAIEKSVADPDYYRQGGLLDGVAHIFIPHSLDRDETWFNNKRLESHGLALKAICDTVIQSGSEKWGFSPEELEANRAKIASVIVSLASYLKSINSRKDGYFDFGAPSAGPWEEIPFPEGLTWDTEAIRSGFESLHNLLNNPRWQGHDEIAKMRLAITAQTMADWLAPESEVLPNLLRLARGKIIDRLFGQAEPVENPHRPMDSSLAFITTSTIALAEDIVEDVQLHLKVLQALEKNLVRAHGIVRYAPFSLPMPKAEEAHTEEVFDSYLADNYWLLPELRAHLSGLGKGLSRDWGSGDCSSHEDYVSRVKLARPGTEAQWCFVSVMAEGYLRQVEKLLRFGEASAHRDLLDYALAKGAEYLNRSFARITATSKQDSTRSTARSQSSELESRPPIKANGRHCPGWSIPEAYEMVSAGFSDEAGAPLAALPGANTPLAWGQSSLFSACLLMEKLLPQIEELKL